MKYLDSNVFIIASLYEGKQADRGKEVLTSLSKGIEVYATSSLTLDEVLWGIIKETRDRDQAIGICKDILEFPTLEILDVTGTDIIKAVWFMEKYPKLKPRDAIHLAVCFNASIFTIITDDSDFDEIEEVNREGLD